MKKIIIAAVVVLVLAGAGWYLWSMAPDNAPIAPGVSTTTPPATVTPTSTAPTSTVENAPETVIGKSVEGRDIVAYNFGTGEKKVLFVGGIHGGYEWNTVLVARKLMDHLKSDPEDIPRNVRVTVIPVLNPDGLNKVVDVSGSFEASDVNASPSVQIAGRYNANKVDLNRNFDCDWQPTAKWRNVTVSGGTSAFSEPESRAMKDYIEAQKPDAVVVWYSAAGGVFASNCHDGVLPETSALTAAYAKASGYPAHQSFDFYSTTGDMTNWLARMEIPAISVLLTNHTDVEWSKNRPGIEAVLKHLAD